MNKKGNRAIYAVPILIIAFIVAVFWGILGFDAVDANHIGVKVRFGSILGTMTEGLQYTGIFTHVEEYDLRTRKIVVDLTGANSAVDRTGQSVFGTIDVNFRIKPSNDVVLKLYREVGSDKVVVDRLNVEPIVREGFKQATAQYDALEITTKYREEVKEKAIALIKANFPTEYFELQNVVITNIDFSQSFKDAIEAKKTAEQEKLKEEEKLKVVIFQQQQQIEISKAEAEKNRLQYQAETDKLRLQKEQITPELVQKAMVDKWDGKYPTTLIITSEKSDNFIPFMPIPNGQ